MATQTTYYEFNKPAGSDLVNPLTDTFPNWDIADAALHELNERSFANATETVVLGVHAISRLNGYTKFIKWIATANFAAGDTFTVDGNVVAASTPSGALLATGAYVTGSVVIACLNADDSAMTIFVSGTNVATDSERLGGELPAYYATASDMSSAQTDIGNIQALNGTTSIVGIGDGTLTGAVSRINTDLADLTTYTLVGSETGTTPIAINPTKSICIAVDFTDGQTPIRIVDEIPLITLPSTDKVFIIGGGLNINTYGYMIVCKLSSSSVTLQDVKTNGSQSVNSSTITVWQI